MSACKHKDATMSERFPRMPLLHGSYAVEICPNCGMWRPRGHVKEPYWRPANLLLIDIARDALGWDDPQ